MTRDSRSSCPIATTLDIVGDRWTLIILRDLLIGKKRYSEFLESAEGIATNVLSDRLTLMEQAGLVTKAPYQLRPKRFEYELTEKGEALLPDPGELFHQLRYLDNGVGGESLEFGAA